jgi:hypothetical protein
MWLPGLERERELPGAVCERERERKRRLVGGGLEGSQERIRL